MQTVNGKMVRDALDESRRQQSLGAAFERHAEELRKMAATYDELAREAMGRSWDLEYDAQNWIGLRAHDPDADITWHDDGRTATVYCDDDGATVPIETPEQIDALMTALAISDTDRCIAAVRALAVAS